MAAVPERSILVLLGKNTRVVTFPSDLESEVNVGVAMSAIRNSFSDVLQPGQEFFLKVKREEWGGVFVDLQEKDELIDKSVVKAEFKEVMKDSDDTINEVGFSRFSPLYARQSYVIYF